MRRNLQVGLQRVGALLVLPPPRSGFLAVLWWAGIIAFFIMAATYTVLTWAEKRSGGKVSIRLSDPSAFSIWAWFVLVTVFVGVILLAIRIIPGT